MVWRFVRRGWRVHLFDLSSQATEPFRDHPLVAVYDDASQPARHAQTAILSLPSPDALLEVSRQLAASRQDRRITTVINTSTTGAIATRQAAANLSRAGVGFVDAPISGGVAGAQRGSLTIMVSGAPELVDSCMPVFDVIGEHVVRIGSEPGQAQAMKVANNILGLGALAATAEATALTSKAGIPLDVAIAALNISSGRNSATAVKFPDNVLTGRFDFGFPVESALKDVSLFTDLAEDLNVPTPLAAAVVACWRLAVDHGYGEQDCTRITTMYERLAGIDTTKPDHHRADELHGE